MTQLERLLKDAIKIQMPVIQRNSKSKAVLNIMRSFIQETYTEVREEDTQLFSAVWKVI